MMRCERLVTELRLVDVPLQKKRGTGNMHHRFMCCFPSISIYIEREGTTDVDGGIKVNMVL